MTSVSMEKSISFVKGTLVHKFRPVQQDIVFVSLKLYESFILYVFQNEPKSKMQDTF